MAKKKGYPLGTFMKEFGTERKCRDHLAKLRWPGGFVCPKCGCRHACLSDTHPDLPDAMTWQCLSDSGDSAPQNTYAIDTVVSGVLLCQSGQTRHLRRCTDVDAGNDL